MKSQTSTPVRGSKGIIEGQDLRAIVAPVAAFVAATNDPRAAVAEVVAELVSEAIAIEIAARQFLGASRTAE